MLFSCNFFLHDFLFRRVSNYVLNKVHLKIKTEQEF